LNTEVFHTSDIISQGIGPSPRENPITITLKRKKRIKLMMSTRNLKTFTQKSKGVKKDTTRPTTDTIPKMLK